MRNQAGIDCRCGNLSRLLIALAGCLGAGTAGCSATFRGPDTDADVHLHATYYLARMAGFEPEPALAIAAADCFTDYHPETTSVATERRLAGGIVNPISLPRILVFGCADWISGRESLSRAFGGRTAETTGWVISPLATRLHFPSRRFDEAVRPAFVRDPETGEIFYNDGNSLGVLEQAFRGLGTRDPDAERALAMLGIGLHAMQDSIKHAGFSPARGHIGVHPDPDDVSLRMGLALEIAEATYHSLLHARRILHGRAPSPGDSWQPGFLKVYESPLREDETREGRWIALIRSTFGDPYGAWTDLRAKWGRAGEGAFERAIDRIRRTDR